MIGRAAEYYRKEKAVLWLGAELPRWAEPCPIHVKVTTSNGGGATSFAFADNNRVLGQTMQIEGRPDRLLAAVVPHEVTHTVFAHYFGQPVRRWADEGAAVLSEDDVEHQRHDQYCREVLSTRRSIPLRRLFGMKEYPQGDALPLYAEGFSVTHYLVAKADRKTFLRFVGQGMRSGWDSAAQSCYGQRTVEDLQADWLKYLQDTRGLSWAQKKSYLAGRPFLPWRKKMEGKLDQQATPQPQAPPYQPTLQPPPAQPDPGGALQQSLQSLHDKFQDLKQSLQNPQAPPGLPDLKTQLGAMQSKLSGLEKLIQGLPAGLAPALSEQLQTVKDQLGLIAAGSGQSSDLLKKIPFLLQDLAAKAGQNPDAIAKIAPVIQDLVKGAPAIGTVASWAPWIAAGGATGGLAPLIWLAAMGIGKILRKPGTGMPPTPANPVPQVVLPPWPSPPTAAANPAPSPDRLVPEFVATPGPDLWAEAVLQALTTIEKQGLKKTPGEAVALAKELYTGKTGKAPPNG